MAGLGAFITGAFDGYEFGDRMQGRKKRREREDEAWEWTKQDRQRQEAERAAEEGALTGAYEHARQTYDPPRGRGVVDVVTAGDGDDSLAGGLSVEDGRQWRGNPAVVRHPGLPPEPRGEPPGPTGPMQRPGSLQRERGGFTGNPAVVRHPGRPPEGAMGAAPGGGPAPAARAQAQTPQPPERGGAPSVQAAADVMGGKGVVGPNGAMDRPPQDKEEAARSFIDHYAETAVPRVVDHYLKQGNIEKAQAFETWAKDRRVRGQLEEWSKAVFSAATGDEEGYLDHLSAAYNGINDGYTVVRDKSGFQRDGDGRIIGGSVTMRNDQTGEEFTQVYDDQEDLIELGIYAFAPEQTFEYLWGLSQQAREMRIEAVRSRSEGGLEEGELVDMIRKEAQSIRESQEFATAEEQLTEDQIVERARQNVMGQLKGGREMYRGGAPGQLPPMPEDWTG